MAWRDLLQVDAERVTLPWVGGRSLRTFDREWALRGRPPSEHGWHDFEASARTLRWVGPGQPVLGNLRDRLTGYLVGDLMIPDGASGVFRVDPGALARVAERVHLIEPGLDTFARVTAGRPFEGGPLIFDSLAFPLGPEDAVLDALLRDAESVRDVSGVTPALDTAFRWAVWQKREVARVRAEEQARREREERHRRVVESLGDSVMRRDVAQEDFDTAARATLAVGGAVFLDARESYNQGERVVRFTVDSRRFECVCDARTLRIIDSGVCLTDHNGRKDDNLLTLESLPGVIREAHRDGVLVVFRRA